MDLLTLTVIAAQTPHRKLGHSPRSWMHASCALTEIERGRTDMRLDRVEVLADWELARLLLNTRCWLCHAS